MGHRAHDETSFVVESTAQAAFATDEEQRIVAWNAAAADLLGLRREQVLGRRCHEVLAGLDANGAAYCRAACVPHEAARCGQPVASFPLAARGASGEPVHMDVAVLVLRRPRTAVRALVHLIRAVVSPHEENGSLEPLRRCARRSREALGLATSPESAAAAESRRRAGLTPREAEILRLLVAGCSPREIGGRLSVSVATVRTHIRNARAKLGVRSVAQAVSKALGEGLV